MSVMWQQEPECTQRLQRWLSSEQWSKLQVAPEESASQQWAHSLVEFYEGVLRCGEVLPSRGSLGQGMRQPSISPDVYANILKGACKFPSILYILRDGQPLC